MRVRLRGLCLLLLAGCTASGHGLPAPVARPFLSHDITRGLRCNPAAGFLQCLRENEPTRASVAEAQPTRQDTRLCVPTRLEAVCFIDREGLGYALLAQAGDSFLIVETEATGGYSVIMVDAANGSQRRVDNRPLPSTGGTLFATVSYDTDAGYVPNRIAIWDARQADPLYEFGDFLSGHGPTGIRWIGPSRLVVRYSRQALRPDSNNSDTFTIWKDGHGLWHHDYRP